MIKNNKTINGIDIKELSEKSGKIVTKICDSCFKEKDVPYRWVLHCRKQMGGDYCHPCANRIVKNNQKLISRLGVNERGKGYLIEWDDERKKWVQQHRLVMERFLERKLLKTETIHHIDLDKKNNSIDNLICVSNSEHAKLHHQLEALTISFLKAGVIFFDKITKQYMVAEERLFNDIFPLTCGFEDVRIAQGENVCESRLEVDISAEVIRGIKLSVPLMSSNMSTVTDSNFAIAINKLGGLGILHRAFPNEQELIEEVKKISKECENVAASIGVGDTQFELCKKIISAGANIIFIDIANGYSLPVIEIAKKIKSSYPSIKVVVGNSTNKEFIYKIYKLADALKIGIGQGLACETMNMTGCGEKQFTAVLKFKKLSKELGIPIISDGGIREPADFAKAIGAGANSIMAGSIFARCPESAAETIEKDGNYFKVYAGMASRYVQNKWKGGLKPGTCPEGTVKYLPIGESVNKLIERYSGALRSSITYGGGNDIMSFQNNIKFVRTK